MKHQTIAALCAMALLSACGTKEKLEKAEEQNTTLNAELQATLATQDSLFALINDITEGMSQIKDIEHIVSAPGALSDENVSRKTQLSNDMTAVREALQQRRERLAQLEQSLKSAKGQNSNLLKTIENLKAQIAEQETEIATLTNQLSAANIEIANLGARVDSLNTTVTTVSGERERAVKEAARLTDELNLCYYVIGTKDELKKHNIIKTGFLRKTKVLPDDYEVAYFTAADKRTLSSLPLHSSKAKIITNQPASSYKIVNEGNQKVLKIVNPDQFWRTTNCLVVQID